MNYIPGFTNYLQASVPQYANGGAVMGDPRQAAVMPMTQEAAPYDLSGFDLSSLGGLNFSGFGGGRMGGVIQDPNIQYITAPVSNKGNPTGRMGGNVFAVKPDQPVRLVDLRTNTIVFEGTGVDAAREATRLGQSMTDSLGRKASYDIQTADPSGAYITVANEKRNKSTLAQLGQVVGTALPIVVSLVPGLQFAGPILSAAIAGGAGAAMAGRDPVKGAIMGGLSAAGGQVLGPALQGAGVGAKAATALGTGLGSTAGGLATGQSLKSSLLGGVASGALSYVAPSIQDELGISTKSGSLFRGGNTSASTGGDTSASTGGEASAVSGGPIVVSGTPFSTPNVNLGGFKTPAQNYLRDARADDVINPETRTPYNTGYDGDLINVTGARVAPGTNLGGFTGNPAVDRLLQPTTELGDENLINVTGTRVVPGTNLGGLTGNPAVDRLIQPEVTELSDEDIIKVTGRRTTSAGNPVVNGVDTVTGEIVTTGNKIEPVTGGLTLPSDLLTDIDQQSEAERKAEEERKKLGLEEYLRLAGLASGLIGGAAGGGGSGSSGTYGGAGGTGRLNPIFSAKLPSAGGLGSIGMNRTARPMGDVDWLTYGTRPELSFFDYAARSNPAPVTTPVPGNPAGPIMAEEPRRSDEGRLPPPEPQKLTPTQLASLEKQRLEQYAYLSQFPGPTPEELARNTALYGNNEAAGPIISAEEPRPMMAKGGAFAAKRGGPSRRTEFAVNGAGTGRSDDIPAVLSDGEYVIDAETVALLGDGSNKAGAKKLDELRIKVRKHKGRKLAKGRFSANAKRPEAYLSGGRI